MAHQESPNYNLHTQYREVPTLDEATSWQVKRCVPPMPKTTATLTPQAHQTDWLNRLTGWWNSPADSPSHNNLLTISLTLPGQDSRSQSDSYSRSQHDMQLLSIKVLTATPDHSVTVTLDHSLTATLDHSIPASSTADWSQAGRPISRILAEQYLTHLHPVSPHMSTVFRVKLRWNLIPSQLHSNIQPWHQVWMKLCFQLRFCDS